MECLDTLNICVVALATSLGSLVIAMVALTKAKNGNKKEDSTP
jgi:uncharacterized Tic20 family protein